MRLLQLCSSRNLTSVTMKFVVLIPWIILIWIPLSQATFNFYMSGDEVKRILGLTRTSPLFYVREGVPNTYALNFLVPVATEVTRLEFIWDSGETNSDQNAYTISVLSSDTGALTIPAITVTDPVTKTTSTLPQSGRVPRDPQKVNIYVLCTGLKSGDVNVQIKVNITMEDEEVLGFVVKRRKVCIEGRKDLMDPWILTPTKKPSSTRSSDSKKLQDLNLPPTFTSSSSGDVGDFTILYAILISVFILVGVFLLIMGVRVLILLKTSPKNEDLGKSQVMSGAMNVNATTSSTKSDATTTTRTSGGSNNSYYANPHPHLQIPTNYPHPPEVEEHVYATVINDYVNCQDIRKEGVEDSNNDDDQGYYYDPVPIIPNPEGSWRVNNSTSEQRLLAPRLGFMIGNSSRSLQDQHRSHRNLFPVSNPYCSPYRGGRENPNNPPNINSSYLIPQIRSTSNRSSPHPPHDFWMSLN